MDGRRNSAFIGRRATESTFGAGTHETEMPLKAVWASSGERGAGCLQVSAQLQQGRQQEHGAPAELSPFPSLIVCLHPHPPCCLTRRTHQGWAGFPRARSRSGFGPKLRAHLQCEKLFSTSDKTKQNLAGEGAHPRGGPSTYLVSRVFTGGGTSVQSPEAWPGPGVTTETTRRSGRSAREGHWRAALLLRSSRGAPSPAAPWLGSPPTTRVGSFRAHPCGPRRGLPDPDPRLPSPRRGFGPGPPGQGGGDGSAGAGDPPG